MFVAVIVLGFMVTAMGYLMILQSQHVVRDPIAWYWMGVREKWCSELLCHTHDGVTFTLEEETAFEAGQDPCITIVRVNTP